MSKPVEKSPFLKIAYITIHNHSSKSFLDYNFFLILDGTVRILKDNQTFFLAKNDVFLFEPDHTYQVSSAGNNIILSIILDNHFFSIGRSRQTGSYICNSALDSARDYTPLRQLLTQIAAVYFGKSDILDLHLLSNAYNLLYYLNAYHYEEAQALKAIDCASSKYKERMNNILNYIHQNYAALITLQKAADYLHLSAPYLSAFFKQNTGQNFNSYVNHIRLEHAIDELIYTDKSITAITYDNGFASMNAFNKIFREIYDTTPNLYRKKKLAERQLQSEIVENAVKELPVSEHADLLQEYGEPSMEFFNKIQFPSQETIDIKDMHSSRPILPIWKKLINVGHLSQISKRDIEKQLNQVQDGIGFEYARIETVVDYHLFQAKLPNHKLLFSAFDRAIDLLMMHQLLPYLDLSLPEEEYALSGEHDVVVDIEHYISFLQQLLKHNANMYGIDYMESWYFEIDPYENPFINRFESIAGFVERFSRSYTFIKKHLPNARVGGICHDVIMDYQRFHEILRQLKQKNIVPDFLCLGIFPFEYIPASPKSSSPMGLFYTKDTSFAKHKLNEFKEMATLHYDSLPQIHIAYLAPDYYSSHYLSDTCFQSTFFFHNTVDLMEQVDMLGYYCLSDIGDQPDTSNDFLEGKNGLFNKYGIKKPAQHMLEMFAKCRDNLVARGNDYIVLKGSLDRYMVGLCNYTYVSDYDCFALNKKIPFSDAYKIYESPQTKNVDLKLHNLSEGEYDIIVYQLGKKYGSALDEWARNGYWECYAREELEYMRKILQPRRTHYVKSSTDGTMEFHMQLAPHEVVFIALLQRW